jgi:hypothetical protein
MVSASLGLSVLHERTEVKIYVTMINDRHVETKAYLFSTKEKAIHFAKHVLDENVGSTEWVHPDDRSMTPNELKTAGWLFYGCYSTEGDELWLLETEVDQKGLI